MSSQKSTDLIFRLSLAVKAIDSLFEIAGGILLMSPMRVDRTIEYLLQHELVLSARHPTTAYVAAAAAAALDKATIAGAIYLLVHGLAKVILIAAVYMDKKWGYQGLIGVLSVFALLECGRGIFERSALPIALAAFDAFIVFLIAKEYRLRNIGGR